MLTSDGCASGPFPWRSWSQTPGPVATTDWATPSRLPLAQCDGQTQFAFHVTALVTFLPWWCAILAMAAQTCAAIAVTDFCASWFHRLLLPIPPGSSCQKKQLKRLCHIRKCQKNQQKIRYRVPHKWFEVGQTIVSDPRQLQPIPKSLNPPSSVSGSSLKTFVIPIAQPCMN